MTTKATKDKATTGLVPKLRFPKFRDAEPWKPVSLGKASTPITERVGERKFTPVSISAGIGFVPQAEKFGRDISGNQYQLYTLVSDGDFVYNKGNSLKFPQGCVYQLQGWGQVAAPNVFISFRLKDGYSDVFFQNCFEQNMHGKQLQKHITSGARSNGLLNISKEHFFGVAIPTPSLAEQQKIADCLGSLDELIAAQGRKVEALKTHKKWLMQQLFPREGETQPRLRFPEFQDAGGWKKKTLGTAAIFYNGRAYKQEELLDAGKYKVLRVGNFFTNNNWYYSNLELDETKYCEDGDLLYAWSASFGPRVWHGEKAIYHYHIWKVVEQSDIDKQFLCIILEQETERMKAKTTNGLGIMHITKGAIESWESSFPSLAEQRRIADRLINLEGATKAEAEKLELLTVHKKGLMQQLFPAIDDIKI